MSQYFSSPEHLRSLFMQVAMFGIVAAFWFAALVFWYLQRSRRAQQLHARLHLSGRPEQEQRVLRLWQDGRLAGETTVSSDGEGGFLDRLDRLREAAGWQTPIVHGSPSVSHCASLQHSAAQPAESAQRSAAQPAEPAEARAARCAQPVPALWAA